MDTKQEHAWEPRRNNLLDKIQVWIYRLPSTQPKLYANRNYSHKITQSNTICRLQTTTAYPYPFVLSKHSFTCILITQVHCNPTDKPEESTGSFAPCALLLHTPVAFQTFPIYTIHMNMTSRKIQHERRAHDACGPLPKK